MFETIQRYPLVLLCFVPLVLAIIYYSLKESKDEKKELKDRIRKLEEQQK